MRTFRTSTDMKTTIRSILITFILLSLGLVPITQAVNPPPDGSYLGANTAEGEEALFMLTLGTFNTAVGWGSLRNATTTNFNTAIGAGALLLNTTGEGNTAVGAGALVFNDHDPNLEGSGNGNTAVGTTALFANTTGAGNTAVGTGALLRNTDGSLNTAVGIGALTTLNGSGFSTSQNTAVGANALSESTRGAENNTAVGATALEHNTSGADNTAIGKGALSRLGEREPTPTATPTASPTASPTLTPRINSNIAVGEGAGSNLNFGSYNVYVGNDGREQESNTIRIGPPFPSPSPSPAPPATGQNRTFIASIYGQSPGANTLPVVCADDGKLTANASSRRFK